MLFQQPSGVVLALGLLASCLIGQCVAQLTYQTDANSNSFTLKTPGLQQSFTRIFGGQQRGNLLQAQPLQQQPAQQQYAAPPASPQYQQTTQQYQQPQFQYQQQQQQPQPQYQQQQYTTAQPYTQALQQPMQQQQLFSPQQQQGQSEQSIDQYQSQYYAYQQQQQQQQLQAQQQYQQQQQALQQALAYQQQQQPQQQQQAATTQLPQLRNKPYYTESEYASYLQQQPLPQYLTSNIASAGRFNGLQPTLPSQQQTFSPTSATYATTTAAPTAYGGAFTSTTEANSKLLGVQYSPSDKVSHVKFSSGNLAYNF